VRAVSGNEIRPGFVNLPPNPIFTTFPARRYDTERKIAEYLFSRFGAAVSPSIAYIHSLITVCGNCRSVVRRYQTASHVAVLLSRY